MKVLSFGEILLRLASPGYTKLFQKDSLDATFCGGEANVAVSLANFGVQSEFLTVVPDNDVGHASLNALRYFGVDTSKTFFKNGRMGLYYLEKGASQRPSKVIYDRAFSSIALAEPADFDWDALFDGVNWFHWTGINPALSDNMVQICEQACKKAREKGITISCDLNFRKNLWSSETAQKVMSNLVRYVDICIANEEDADKVLGIKAPNNNVESGKLNKSGYEYVAKEICERFGCKKVAITLRESINASRNGWSGMICDTTGIANYSTHYFAYRKIVSNEPELESIYDIRFVILLSCGVLIMMGLMLVGYSNSWLRYIVLVGIVLILLGNRNKIIRKIIELRKK